MNITQARADELRGQTFGTLQSTDEFTGFIREYIESEARNMHTEVSYILKKSHEDTEAPFSYDDFDNYRFNYENLIYDLKKAIELLDTDDLKEFLEEVDFESKENVLLRIGELEDKQAFDVFCTASNIGLDTDDYDESVEIMQWFLLNDGIIHQLEKRGEVILDDKYWGRQGCGQAIMMDAVIINIFKEWYLPIITDRA